MLQVPSTAGSAKHKSLDESYGFFDYPDDLWEGEKTIMRRQSKLNRMSDAGES